MLGRDDIAEPLERMLPYILSDDANIEVLTLLLALSEQPAEAVEFDQKKFVKEDVVTKNEITWEEILAEEPLVGDHWKEPVYSDSDEEDWVYEPTLVEKAESPVPETPKEPPVVEKHVERNVTGKLLERQYWIRRKKRVLRKDDDAPESRLPGISVKDSCLEKKMRMNTVHSMKLMQFGKSSLCFQDGIPFFS